MFFSWPAVLILAVVLFLAGAGFMKWMKSVNEKAAMLEELGIKKVLAW